MAISEPKFQQNSNFLLYESVQNENISTNFHTIDFGTYLKYGHFGFWTLFDHDDVFSSKRSQKVSQGNFAFGLLRVSPKIMNIFRSSRSFCIRFFTGKCVSFMSKHRHFCNFLSNHPESLLTFFEVRHHRHVFVRGTLLIYGPRFVHFSHSLWLNRLYADGRLLFHGVPRPCFDEMAAFQAPINGCVVGSEVKKLA